MGDATLNYRVVVIGGGTGLPVLIRGLKKFPFDITAIVTVADDGGSSGRLRKDMDIPPPGDIRNVLAALSDVEPFIEEMFQHRFKSENELSGHTLGNLILAAMTSITGNFVHAIQEMSKVLNVRGKVLPAANQSVVLNAIFEDGSIVSGESIIPKQQKRIKKVYLNPSNVLPLPESITAIRKADLIVFGPGSLYTSILPNLLVQKIGKEICKSSAKKVFVCNLMTQEGETYNYTVSDHIEALYSHVGCEFLDAVIANNTAIPEELKEVYQQQNSIPVEVDLEKLSKWKLKCILGNYIFVNDTKIRHNTLAIAKTLYELLEKK